MSQTPKAPPLPSKGGSFTVDSRNRLKQTDEPTPQAEPKAKTEKDVSDA